MTGAAAASRGAPSSAGAGGSPPAPRALGCGARRRRRRATAAPAPGAAFLAVPRRAPDRHHRARPRPPGSWPSFTVLAGDRAELDETFARADRRDRGPHGGPAARGPRPRLPAAADSGILGPEPPPDDLSVVVSVGASLFDGRYGLADRKPRELVQMPFLANDRLDPARSHGDLLLTIAGRAPGHRPLRAAPADAAHPPHAGAALGGRRLQPARRRPSRAHDRLAAQPAGLHRRHRQPRRRRRRRCMDRHVWVGAGDGEPAWAAGGSYHACA